MVSPELLILNFSELGMVSPELLGVPGTTCMVSPGTMFWCPRNYYT